MSQSKKPARRTSKRTRATLPSIMGPRMPLGPPPRGQIARSERRDPSDDTPLSLLRAQVERAETELQRAKDALGIEKEARAMEAASVGEMMGRESRAVERARIAEQAVEEMRSQGYEDRRRMAELEAKLAVAQIDRVGARSELEAKAEELLLFQGRAADEERSYQEEIARLVDELAEVRSRAKSADPPAQSRALKAELESERAEVRRLRENLDSLRGRAGTIGAGLKEMRDLMVESAALFDELERREHAIAEVRSKSMREARLLFLRAAQQTSGIAPPVPSKPHVEDLSDLAELLDEDVRRSSRPPPGGQQVPKTLRGTRQSAWPTEKSKRGNPTKLDE
jgi:hypothetical protein